jgi:hypothetical protein
MIKLNWNRYLVGKHFLNRRKPTGFNISIPYRSENFAALIDGMIMWVKNSRGLSINTTFVITTPMANTRLFMSLPINLIGGYKYMITGFSFSRKVRSSRLTKRKLSKMNALKI